MKYGRLSFIEKTQAGRNPKALYRCECGTIKEISTGNVKAGRTVSCGCRLKETHAPTHGMSKTSTYQSWENMKNRCNANSVMHRNCKESYDGVTICEKWLKFEGFWEDMGEKPKGTSIDRVDGAKGYYKENCKWSTRKEQQNNLRSNVRIEFRGRIETIAEWSNILGIPSNTITTRMKKGLPIELVLCKKRVTKVDLRLGTAAIIKGLAS